MFLTWNGGQQKPRRTIPFHKSLRRVLERLHQPGGLGGTRPGQKKNRLRPPLRWKWPFCPLPTHREDVRIDAEAMADECGRRASETAHRLRLKWQESQDMVHIG